MENIDLELEAYLKSLRRTSRRLSEEYGQSLNPSHILAALQSGKTRSSSTEHSESFDGKSQKRSVNKRGAGARSSSNSSAFSYKPESENENSSSSLRKELFANIRTLHADAELLDEQSRASETSSPLLANVLSAAELLSNSSTLSTSQKPEATIASLAHSVPSTDRSLMEEVADEKQESPEDTISEQNSGSASTKTTFREKSPEFPAKLDLESESSCYTSDFETSSSDEQDQIVKTPTHASVIPANTSHIKKNTNHQNAWAPTTTVLGRTRNRNHSSVEETKEIKAATSKSGVKTRPGLTPSDRLGETIFRVIRSNNEKLVRENARQLIEELRSLELNFHFHQTLFCRHAELLNSHFKNAKS